MKHLKKISELNSSTYLSAADKLSKFGHKERPEELKKHVNNLKRKKLVKCISEFGEYDINDYSKPAWNRITKCNFLIKIDEVYLKEEFELYKNNRISTLYLPLLLYPININSNYNLENIPNHKYYFEINIINKFKSSLPDAHINIDNYEGNNTLFTDRKNAVKFKKMLFKLFNGDIEYYSFHNNPKEIYSFKERLNDILFDEIGLSFEEIEEFIKSINKIRVNLLYKD